MKNGTEDEGPGPQSGGELVWTGDYPVSRNKTVSISLLAVSTISVGLVSMSIVALSMDGGDYEHLPKMLLIMAGIWAGFTIGLFLIGLLFFGGKVPTEVAIGDRKIVQTMLSRRARASNLLAVAGGLLAGGSRGVTAAGAGLLAQARQIHEVDYSGLRKAKGDPETGEIRLWDDWHTVMQLFVPPQHYQEAMRRLESGIAKAAAKRSVARDIPTAVKALVAVGALVFGAFLLADFPLDFSGILIVPMAVLGIAAIVSPPGMRRKLGWLLAAAESARDFRVQPANRWQPLDASFEYLGELSPHRIRFEAQGFEGPIYIDCMAGEANQDHEDRQN